MNEVTKERERERKRNVKNYLDGGEVEPLENGGLDRDCDGEALVNKT